MQLLKTKLLSLFVFLGLFALATATVQAETPRVTGRVIYADTGEGIEGIIVKWEDTHDIANGIYYARTDASGQYVFPDFGEINRPKGAYESSERIDTDYNGSLDSPVWKVAELTPGEKAEGFGCSQNPHTFSVTKKPNMVGEFENNNIIRNRIEINNGADSLNLPDIKFVRANPICPGNIRQLSCDQTNKTVTMAWDAPPGGADGYKLYFDKTPLSVGDSGDVLNLDMSNNLQRSQKIDFDTDYLLRIKSLKKSGDQTVESESCLAQVRCDTICQPGDTSCCPPGTPGCDEDDDDDDDDEEDDKKPTATLTGVLCPVKPSPFYYQYTYSNIDTKGYPFLNSKLMITFIVDSQTDQILNFLNGSSVISNEKGFSQWRELNRPKRNGDYFGFYVQNYDSIPNQPFRLDDSTAIGNTNIGALRQFLDENNLPTQFNFKANMRTRLGLFGELFNSHIPAPGKINLAASQDAVCQGGESCTEEISCIEDITITNPGNDIIVPVKTGSKETITITWTSAAAAGSQYEVILYDTTAHDSAQDAYDDREASLNTGTPIPTTLQYFETINKSQSFDISKMGKSLAVGVRGYETTCPLTGANVPSCSWTEKNIRLGFTVSGKFYQNDSCLVAGSSDVDLSGSTVSPNGQLTADGKGYSVTLEYNTTNNITLQIAGNTYMCATQLSCPTRLASGECQITNVTGPATDKHFFVKTILSQFESWWQVRGGLVYGHDRVQSSLPFDIDGNSPCTEPNCKPFLVRREYLNSAEKSAGVPMTTGAFSSDINGWWTDRAAGNRAHGEGTSNILAGEAKEDFKFFHDLIKEDVMVQTSPGTITDLPAGTSLGDNTEVLLFTGDVTIKPNSTWGVGNKRVILVDGNITFQSNGPEKIISVAEGGFLAFIASKNISFDKGIGNDDYLNNDPNVEGIFIADQQLIVQSNGPTGGDKKFIGAGTFVGWGNVDLQRRFNNPSDANDIVNLEKNTQMPVESFFFRPDFAVNTPEFMRSATFTWKEVN